MKVGVTGAAGFVGRYMVGHLAQLGHEVIGVVREGQQSGGHATETVDLERYEELEEFLTKQDPEALVHCAAQASVGRSWDDPQRTYRTNILGAGNLMEALKGRSVRVLVVGSAQQYGRSESGRPLSEGDRMSPGSPYAVSKVAQEHIGLVYHRRYHLDVLFTRSFNHTGPGQGPDYAVGSFCSQVAALEKGAITELRVGNLEAIRDLLDVRDVVAAYGRLLEAGAAGEVYNVCSGRGVRMGDLLQRIMEMAEIPPDVRIIADMQGGEDVLVGDPSKVCSEVGWAPQIPLDRSLAESLDWYRDRVGTPLA